MFNSVVGLLLVCILNIMGVAEPDGTYNECFVFNSGKINFQIGGLIVSNQRNNLKHEYGHYLQEQMLGVYYLPLVGLTSAFGNIRRLPYGEYHKLWSETWADKLGGVYELQNNR